MQLLSMKYTGISEYDMFSIDAPKVWVRRVVNGTSVNWFVYSYESMSHLSIPMLKDEAIIKEYLLDSAHLKTVLTMLI